MIDNFCVKDKVYLLIPYFKKDGVKYFVSDKGMLFDSLEKAEAAKVNLLFHKKIKCKLKVINLLED